MGNGFGISALIFGIVGCIFCGLLLYYSIRNTMTFYIQILGLILGISSLIFGPIGIAKDDSKAPGIIGLIFGIITVIIYVLYLL
ncbi:MAG: hypothetical protein ACFFAH_01730 [Promethearchaeota archaeon]